MHYCVWDLFLLKDESGLKRVFVVKLFVVKNFYSDNNRSINNELFRWLSEPVKKFPPPRFWRKSTFLDSTRK